MPLAPFPVFLLSYFLYFLAEGENVRGVCFQGWGGFMAAYTFVCSLGGRTVCGEAGIGFCVFRKCRRLQCPLLMFPVAGSLSLVSSSTLTSWPPTRDTSRQKHGATIFWQVLLPFLSSPPPLNHLSYNSPEFGKFGSAFKETEGKKIVDAKAREKWRA